MSSPTRPSVPRGDTVRHHVDGESTLGMDVGGSIGLYLFGPRVFKVSVLY